MIADDHILIREGLKQLLEFAGDISVIAEASDGEECLSVLESVVPDVLLLDINMPKMKGLDVLVKLRENNNPLKVIFLTVHNEIEYLVKAVDLGADGYLLKDSDHAELKKAIETVVSGETYIQPSLVPQLNNRLISMDGDKEKIKELTDREIEVLILVATGMLNKEIALQLDISERTVKNHISSIFRKIDVSDRTQAAVFAIKNDLLKLY